MARIAAVALLACPAFGWKSFGNKNINKVDWSVVPPEALHDLSDETASALERCGGLSVAHVNAIRPEAFKAINPRCISSMHSTALSQLTDEQAQHFTATTVAALSASQTAHIPASACAGFGKSVGFLHLPQSVCEGLTAECLAAVPPSGHVSVTKSCFLPLQKKTIGGSFTHRAHVMEQRRIAKAAARAKQEEDAAAAGVQTGGSGFLFVGALLVAVAAWGWSSMKAGRGYHNAPSRATLAADPFTGEQNVPRYDGGRGYDDL